MEKQKPEPDELTIVLNLFEEALRNYVALGRQIERDAMESNLMIWPDDKDALRYADNRVVEMFRRVCITAHWSPYIMDVASYDTIRQAMNVEQFRQLYLGEWIPPEDDKP